MPRENAQRPANQTPFAQRLQDWMWEHRPPITNGQLTYRLGLNKSVVWNWLNRGNIPDPATLQRLAEVTGIPLAEWYTLVGIPLPPTPAELLAAEWERMIVDVVAAMRDAGQDEPAIQQVVAHIRDRQFGTHRERHVLAEFAPPPPETVVDAADQPTLPLPAQRPTTPPAKRSTNNRTAPQRRETSAPRRRHSAN